MQFFKEYPKMQGLQIHWNAQSMIGMSTWLYVHVNYHTKLHDGIEYSWTQVTPAIKELLLIICFSSIY